MSLLDAFKSMFIPAARVTPANAANRVKSGAALLVDVREPSEWSSGVAEKAVLLPLSDLKGPRLQWKSFLERAKGKEVLVYCASGMRSGTAAKILAAEGFQAANTGGLMDWASAGWPTVAPRRS